MKRKNLVQRPRPDVYTQALNAAKKRIEKALAEKVQCEAQLSKLNQEIPRLQRIIDVFEPQPTQSENERAIEMSWVGKGKPAPGVKPSPEALKQVPDHLKRFVQPILEEPHPLPLNGSAEDQFLPDVE